MTISKKIVLSLLMSAIVPSAYAMDAAALKCVPGFENFEGTAAQAKQLVLRPDVVKSVKDLDPINRPNAHSVLAAVSVAPKASAATLVDKATKVDYAVNNGSFGVVDHDDLTAEIVGKISLLHDAGEDVTDGDAINAANDPLIADLLKDSKFQRSQVEAFKKLKEIRDAKGNDLSDGEEDEVVNSLHLYNLGYRSAEVTRNHHDAYKQLATGTQGGVDTAVGKIATPTKLDVDTLLALNIAGNFDPSAEEFNAVKILVSNTEYAQQTQAMAAREKRQIVNRAIHCLPLASSKHFAEIVIGAYLYENVLGYGRLVNFTPTNQLTDDSKKQLEFFESVHDQLASLKILKPTGNLRSSPNIGCLDMMSKILFKDDVAGIDGKHDILGDTNAVPQAGEVLLLGYLREAEVAAAAHGGALDWAAATALTRVANVTPKGIEIAQRVYANPGQYLFAGSEYLNPMKIAAVGFLDTFLPENAINSDSISTAFLVGNLPNHLDRTVESYHAVWMLLEVGVQPTANQVKAVREANELVISKAIAWKISQQNAANPGYVPTGLVRYLGLEGGNGKFEVIHSPAVVAAAARVIAAPVGGRSTIFVAPANFPAKATAAGWAIGDLAFFDNLNDDAVNAALVQFDNADGTFPDNRK